MSKTPKKGSKVLVYEGGILPICNVDGVRNSMEVSDICDLPSLREVGYEIETMAEVYISLFVYPRKKLVGLRGTEGAVWGREVAGSGLMGVEGGHSNEKWR